MFWNNSPWKLGKYVARWEEWILSSKMSVLLRKRITEVLLNQGSSRIVLNRARLSFMRFWVGDRWVVTHGVMQGET